jgi:hypothetical protein
LTKTKTTADRVTVLENRINYLENHASGNNNAYEIKKAKEEIAAIQAEEAKLEKLRHLPLYSSRITGFKFVCSSCYDQAYLLSHQQERNKKL